MKPVAPRVAALLASVMVALSAGSPATAKGEVAFPDGTWKGSPVLWRGSVSQGDVFAEGTADVDFSLTVSEGEVVDGSMSLGGRVASVVEGDPPVSISGTVTGSYELGGSASKVLMSGTVRFDLRADIPGIRTVPLDPLRASGDAGHFSPTFVSCNRVTGDLSTETERTAREFGVNASIDAAFVALPVEARDAAHVIEQYASVVEVLKGLIARTRKGRLPSETELEALTKQAQELQRTVHAQSPCTAPAGGTGQSDPVVVGLVSELMLELLGYWEEDLSVEELIDLLMLASRLGLDPEVEAVFVDALAARIPDLVDALGQGQGEDVYTDWPTELKQLHGIYTIAQLLGLEDLAALAKRELDNFGIVEGKRPEPVDA